MSTSFLMWALLFGSAGLGFFIYGKKQKAPVPMVCGVLLMVSPYLVSSTVVLVVIGIALIALIYFFRL